VDIWRPCAAEKAVAWLAADACLKVEIPVVRRIDEVEEDWAEIDGVEDVLVDNILKDGITSFTH